MPISGFLRDKSSGAFHTSSKPARLLLSETDSFLNSNRELLVERLVRLVRREIETVETILPLANNDQLQQRKLLTKCATWAIA